MADQDKRPTKSKPAPRDGVKTTDGRTVRAAKRAMPRPETRVAVANVASRSIGRLIRKSATSQLLGQFVSKEAQKQASHISLGGSVLGMVAARIATRSVPGAIFVGTVMVGKAYHDYRKSKSARATDPSADEAADFNEHDGTIIDLPSKDI